MTDVLTMVKIWENNKTKEIGLVTPNQILSGLFQGCCLFVWMSEHTGWQIADDIFDLIFLKIIHILIQIECS